MPSAVRKPRARAAARTADLDRLFKAMRRNGFAPRVLMREGEVEVLAAPLDETTPAPVVADDLDAELAAWRARNDQGGN